MGVMSSSTDVARHIYQVISEHLDIFANTECHNEGEDLFVIMTCTTSIPGFFPD